jgi:hypothetical protein
VARRGLSVGADLHVFSVDLMHHRRCAFTAKRKGTTRG